MTNNLDIFRSEFLGANTWAQRKEGVPLELLNKLSPEERRIAEVELIESAGLRDTWPILGLGYIKSVHSLPTLYSLLDKSDGSFKVTVAYAIFQICQDRQMIDVVLEELPGITDQYELIDVLYLLPVFNSEEITKLLNNYCNHEEYLVAYNATNALGLPVDEVIRRARK